MISAFEVLFYLSEKSVGSQVAEMDHVFFEESDLLPKRCQ